MNSECGSSRQVSIAALAGWVAAASVALAESAAASTDTPLPKDWVPAVASPEPKDCPKIHGLFRNKGPGAPKNPPGPGYAYLSEVLGLQEGKTPDTVEIALDGTQLSGVLRWAGDAEPEENFTQVVRCADGEMVIESNEVATNPYPTTVHKKRIQMRLSMLSDGALLMKYVESERNYSGSLVALMDRNDELSWYRFDALSKPPGGLGGEWLEVPKGYPPVIDGRLDDGVWETALSVELKSGSSVRLVHDGRYLFVAFDAQQAAGWGFGVLYVAREDQVLAMHASAQTGSAVYRPTASGTWSPDAATYTWKEAAQLVREEGWYANVVNEGGANGREFAVRLDLLKSARIALVYARQEGETGRVIHTWPADLQDGAGDMRLVEGRNPDGLMFEPAKWIALSFAEH